MDSLKNLGFYYLKEPSAFENIRTVSITELNFKKKAFMKLNLRKKTTKMLKRLLPYWNEMNKNREDIKWRCSNYKNIPFN